MTLNVRCVYAAACLLTILCVACQPAASTPPTSTPPPAVTPNPTEEIAANDISITVIATDDGQPSSLSTNGAYAIVASSAQVFTADGDIAIPENYPQLPQDSKFTVITATISNVNASQPITIEQEHLSLIDSEGNRYPPVEVGDGISPLLYDLQLAREESIVGFALFALPEDATPERIQWCPEGDCEQIVQSPFVISQMSS